MPLHPTRQTPYIVTVEITRFLDVSADSQEHAEVKAARAVKSEFGLDGVRIKKVEQG